jgi:hypothetical protein
MEKRRPPCVLNNRAANPNNHPRNPWQPPGHANGTWSKFARARRHFQTIGRRPTASIYKREDCHRSRKPWLPPVLPERGRCDVVMTRWNFVLREERRWYLARSASVQASPFWQVAQRDWYSDLNMYDGLTRVVQPRASIHLRHGEATLQRGSSVVGGWKKVEGNTPCTLLPNRSKPPRVSPAKPGCNLQWIQSHVHGASNDNRACCVCPAKHPLFHGPWAETGSLVREKFSGCPRSMLHRPWSFGSMLTLKFQRQIDSTAVRTTRDGTV